MKKALSLAVVALLAVVASSAVLKAASRDAHAAALKVTVHYTGKGKVDAAHKLWVWVFDTPQIGPGSMPVDQISLDKNDAEASFEGLAEGKFYIAAAFDETGSMMGDAPPPTGTPIGILGMASGAPTPVTPGKDPAVLTFDDSMRMP
jgi:uncharacterized protein (DUF2141 family)